MANLSIDCFNFKNLFSHKDVCVNIRRDTFCESIKNYCFIKNLVYFLHTGKKGQQILFIHYQHLNFHHSEKSRTYFWRAQGYNEV